MLCASKLLAVVVIVTAQFTGRASAGPASSAAAGVGRPAGFFDSNGISRRCRSTSIRACSPIVRDPTRCRWSGCAATLPGDSIAGEVVVGGLLNFLNIYNILITGRVLLSWVPQLQGVAALQPVYLLTDPYLNVFRRLNLTFGGLDLSVLPAFFLLSFATNAVASLGAEMPSTVTQNLKGVGGGGVRWWEARRTDMARARRQFASSTASAIHGHVVSRTSRSGSGDGTPTRRRLFAFRP
ncbi:unnamed protein product [Ascophyllum nodosum]